jgi:hypothetical protein
MIFNWVFQKGTEPSQTFSRAHFQQKCSDGSLPRPMCDQRAFFEVAWGVFSGPDFGDTTVPNLCLKLYSCRGNQIRLGEHFLVVVPLSEWFILAVMP